jgi:hypothetical protein
MSEQPMNGLTDADAYLNRFDPSAKPYVDGENEPDRGGAASSRRSRAYSVPAVERLQGPKAICSQYQSRRRSRIPAPLTI